MICIANQLTGFSIAGFELTYRISQLSIHLRKLGIPIAMTVCISVNNLTLSLSPRPYLFHFEQLEHLKLLYSPCLDLHVLINRSNFRIIKQLCYPGHGN